MWTQVKFTSLRSHYLIRWTKVFVHARWLVYKDNSQIGCLNSSGEIAKPLNVPSSIWAPKQPIHHAVPAFSSHYSASAMPRSMQCKICKLTSKSRGRLKRKRIASYHMISLRTSDNPIASNTRQITLWIEAMKRNIEATNQNHRVARHIQFGWQWATTSSHWIPFKASMNLLQQSLTTSSLRLLCRIKWGIQPRRRCSA